MSQESLPSLKKKQGEKLGKDEVAINKQKWNSFKNELRRYRDLGTLDGIASTIEGIAEFEQRKQEMINELKARNSENEALKGEIAELRNSIAKKAGTKKGAKLLQNDKVVKAIYTWFKDGPFRNNKFFLNDKHRDQWVEAAWEHLKDSLSLEQAPTNLDWEKFKAWYTPAVAAACSKSRQYVQSEAQKAAEGELCLVLRLIRFFLH